MTQIDDGGPAFPTHFTANVGPDGVMSTCGIHGMSLRDWFAGQAMIALVRLGASEAIDDYGPRPIASDAYDFADAMIAERTKRGGE